VRPTDAPALVQSLSGLADVYGARAVSDKAAKVWLDVLREFPIERVCSLLSGWPKANARMPVPRDVWTVLNDERTEDIERRNAAEKAQEKREVARMFDPRIKNANMAKIRSMITVARADGPPIGRQLCQAIIEDIAEGRRANFSVPQRAFIAANLEWNQQKIDSVEADAQRCAAESQEPEVAEEWMPA
jgi:hypothetical protein